MKGDTGKALTHHNILKSLSDARMVSATETVEFFERGDYARAAMSGDTACWQHYAALGIIGLFDLGLSGLARFSRPECDFYCGLIHWLDGRDEEALRIMASCRDPSAAQLLQLISQPQIRVLGQLPSGAGSYSDPLSSLYPDQRFAITNIGSDNNDSPNRPNADIHEYYDKTKPPHFYVCREIEWHALAPNLVELPCPIFGHTCDYDAHMQTLKPWLPAFDRIIVNSMLDWDFLTRVSGQQVCSFPKSYGIPEPIPSLPETEKDIDILMPGNTMHPYHPDKAVVINQILRLADKGIKIHSPGFVPQDEYMRLLARTRVSIPFARMYGAIQSRTLEALCMGSAAIVQRGSISHLFFGENAGVLSYAPNEEDLGAAAARALNHWPEYEVRARRGAKIVRENFGMSKFASHYLRFLTFLAAKCGRPAQRPTAARFEQKRAVFMHGWNLGPAFYQRLLHENAERWGARLRTAPSAQLFNDFARELVLLCATSVVPHRYREQVPLQPELLASALNIFRIGLVQFPRSLVLRFNYIRAGLHLGAEQDVQNALNVAQQTLQEADADWQIDSAEDIYPIDFFPEFFDYRRYIDWVNRGYLESAFHKPELVKTILAALAHYRSFYRSGEDYFKLAVGFNPDFAPYKLALARFMMRQGSSAADAEAESILLELAGNSVCFEDAIGELVQLSARGGCNSNRLAALQAKLRVLRPNADGSAAATVLQYNAKPLFAHLAPESDAAAARGN